MPTQILQQRTSLAIIIQKLSTHSKSTDDVTFNVTIT